MYVLSNDLGGPGNNPQFVSWDDKWAMAHLLMYDITKGPTYLAKVYILYIYSILYGGGGVRRLEPRSLLVAWMS